MFVLQFFQRFRRFSAGETKNWAITNSDCLTAEMIFMTLAESQQLKEPKTSFLPSTKRDALTIESCFRAIIKGWVTCLQFVAQWVSYSAKRWRVGSLRRSSSKPSENSPYFGINLFVDHTIYIYNFYQDTIRTVHFFMLFSSTTHNLPNSENSDDDAAWLFARPRDAAGFRSAVRRFVFFPQKYTMYI